MTRREMQKGQVLVIVALAMAIFLFGAVGLAIDGAHLFAQRQMAQAAADAAAQAAMMSIFTGTNTLGQPTYFPTSAFTCASYPNSTPCQYVLKNGFGGSPEDEILIDYPDASAAPGVNLSDEDPINLVRATVTRRVPTTFMRLLGSSFSQVRAVAIAAITDVVSPIPMIVTHPTLPGSFAINGNPIIQICGGPQRSIQVNSSSQTALAIDGNPVVDLSKGGPMDPPNNPCTSGTGSDFASFGGPGGPSTGLSWMSLGTTGRYIQPAAPISDPLASVPVPTDPGPPEQPPQPLADGEMGCPSSPQKPCKLYSPGRYDYILVQNETAIFKPGLYYITGSTKVAGRKVAFGNFSNGEMYMCAGCPTATPFSNGGMMVYNAGTGAFYVGANAGARLVGSDENSIYKGILFFQRRDAPATQHRLGGGGALILKGTIYLNNTIEIMRNNASQYQVLELQGTPGQQTLIMGQIITGTLSLGGNAQIRMLLDPAARYFIRQVALVK